MTGSAVDKELMQYFTKLNEQQKKSLLEMIKTFLNPFNNEEDNVTIDEYNRELTEAEAAFERGDYITHQDMLKQIKGW